jgi:hypothetical protein
VTGLLSLNVDTWIDTARADVLRTSRALLEAEERVETLRRQLEAAKNDVAWISLSHRAATIDLRNAEAAKR